MKKILLLLSMTISCSYAQVVFQPTKYQPVETDNSILERSLKRMENRRIEAEQQYSELQIKMADYGKKLYSDEETLIWFDEYKKNISHTYNTLLTMSAGDARDYAIRMQGDLALDPELAARIKTANEYSIKRRGVEERTDWDWKTKNEWIEKNPYCFIPIKNSEGEVIGGRLGTKKEYDDLKAQREKLRK